MATPDKFRPRTCLQYSLRKTLVLHKSRYKLALFSLGLLLLCSLTIIALHAVLSHNISLDIPSLCEINQKLDNRHSLGPTYAQRKNSTKFSILTLVDRHALSTMAGAYPSFLESRSLYASLHGYVLRMYFHAPDVRRQLVWSKVLAIQEIFFPGEYMQTSTRAADNQHKDLREEWVWVLDLDALIFNFNVRLESIVESAIQHPNSAGIANNGAGCVDMIIACDHNGLNAGSFMMRKSEWSREFLSRWWKRGNDEGTVPRMDKLFEQAALTDLVQRDKSVAAHVHIVPIRYFNAYGYPSGELYQFRTGDFVVHCPGPTLKKWLPAYAGEWEKMMGQCKLRKRWMDAGQQFEEADAAAAAAILVS